MHVKIIGCNMRNKNVIIILLLYDFETELYILEVTRLINLN